MRATVAFLPILLFCIFCFSGGLFVTYNYAAGEAVSIWEARNIVSAPFFAGLLLLGTLGMLNMYWHPTEKRRFLLGFAYVVVCAVGVEALFIATQGGVWK